MQLFISKSLKYLLVFIITIIVYNISIDSVGIFWRNDSFGSREPNQRIIKSKILINDFKHVKLLIIGDSRAGFIPVNPNLNEYNFSYSEGVPQEFITDLKYLVDHNITIDTIILALDNISYSVNPTLHDDQFMRFGIQNRSMWVYKLLETPKILNDIHWIRTAPKIKYNFNYTGNATLQSNFQSTFSEWDKPSFAEYYSDNLDSSLSSIESISHFCQKNRITLLPIFLPLYSTTRDFFELKNEMFINRCQEIFEIRNFNLRNEITNDKELYLETSHFKPQLGSKILDEIRSNTHNISEIRPIKYSAVNESKCIPPGSSNTKLGIFSF